MNIRKFQEKIEEDFKYWVTRKIGVTFLIFLIGFSIVVYGFIAIPWVIFVDGIPSGFDGIVDYLYNGNIAPFYTNPMYAIVIGCFVMLLGILRLKGIPE